MGTLSSILGGALVLSLAAGGALGLGAVVACGQTIVQPAATPDPCKLQVVQTAIIASPRINLAENGEPRPVQVRMYQLTSDTRFNNATFEQIWKKDKEVLQDELVKVTELSIYPDSRTDIKFERDPKAMNIAAVALFRTPKGRAWYTILELPPPPGAGACNAACPEGDCPGGDADAGKNAPRALKYAIWVDGSRIDEGSDHLDEFPAEGRRREVNLEFSSPEDGVPGGAKKGAK